MNLLLDTHVLLWWLADDPALPPPIRQAISTEELVVVSAAVAWEIAIKRALGKLKAPDDLTEAVADAGFAPLPITLAHAHAAGGLPRHHDDPFDRMLVAQARYEDLVLVTADRRLAAYEVTTLPWSDGRLS